MSAHTPAPWLTDERFPECIYADDATGSVVARVAGLGFELVARPESEWRANRALVAAAPTMLAKLQRLADECAECRGMGFAPLPFSGGVLSKARCPACRDIRDVIDLATKP